MSKTVTPEQNKVIPLDVELARVLGFEEAIFIGQLRYWLRKSNHEINGQKWIYNPLREWVAQLPMGAKAIRSAIKRLESRGVLLVANFNKYQKLDRTKWFSLDEKKLRSEEWLREQRQELEDKKQKLYGKIPHLTPEDKSSDPSGQMHLSPEDRTIPVDYVQENTSGTLVLQTNADALKKSGKPQEEDTYVSTNTSNTPVETSLPLNGPATPLSPKIIDYCKKPETSKLPPGLAAVINTLLEENTKLNNILPFELDSPLTPNEDGEFSTHAHQLIVDYGTSLNEQAWWYTDEDADQGYTRRRIKENFQDGATVLGLCWSVYGMETDEITADGLYDATPIGSRELETSHLDEEPITETTLNSSDLDKIINQKKPTL